jgi:hypothetical protein
MWLDTEGDKEGHKESQHRLMSNLRREYEQRCITVEMAQRNL